MSVEWEPSATAELVEHVVDYAERYDPVVAYRIYDDVRERAEILDDQPRLGRPGRVRGTREFVVTGTPFILVYQVESSTVRMLRVLHGHQQWPSD
ncbi:MAG TPA: type II toxin-antitoxin system RelE/ParE family toxin [Gammaproteobacteria bacterium]|nr:type II toxin-antitoxin system RelE/ParE family toxin [Gammaproteobacteria bacterium]